jgi:hypothetical protein
MSEIIEVCTLLDAAISRQSLISSLAVFYIYAVLTTSVFNFKYPRSLLYVKREKSVVSVPIDAHFLGSVFC